MLKLRVITALIAAPLVIAAIFLLPLIPFAIVFFVAASLGLLEWANLAGIRGRRGASRLPRRSTRASATSRSTIHRCGR